MASPSKRDTVWPGSSISTGLKRRTRTDDENVSRFSASQIPQIPEALYKRRARPPGIGLKVNPDSQSFKTGENAMWSKAIVQAGTHLEEPKSPDSIRVKGEPWKWYFRILIEDDEDHAIIAYRQSDNFSIVAIKKQAHKDEESIRKIVRCSHENIVNLQQCFVTEKYLFFVYEMMEISLADIQATPYGAFEAYHIAVVCQKVIHGIQYIHDKLRILHGSIDASSVMVDRNGGIKIANIGKSMLTDITSAGDEQRDYAALGLLMVRLMEIGTSLTDPDTVNLKNPEKWNNDITEFLDKTTRYLGESLLEVENVQFTCRQLLIS